jgi:hypothetical protein
MKYLATLLILIPVLSFGQSFELSENAQISVITCGPSQDQLYTAFGHSAIRVFDPARNFDAAYNYGVFDFDQPNFYLNFARGYLYYKLGVYSYQDFQAAYIYHNRFIHEQVLNLTAEQRQKVFDYLQNNALPENQTYRYDYFYNNCATKVRDVFVEALGNDVVKFDGSYVKTDYTIRNLTDIYLKKQPWGDLGIDICLGLPMDKKATPYEYMFLPDYVESGFDHATVAIDGKSEPIVKRKNMIYEERPVDEGSSLPHPLFFTAPIALFALYRVYADFKRKNVGRTFDVFLFGITGLLGLLLFFLWFFTDHEAAESNLNVLWAMPLHLIATIALFTTAKWIKPYFLVTTIITFLLLISWPWLPQLMHYALLPIVLAQCFRAYTITLES